MGGKQATLMEKDRDLYNLLHMMCTYKIPFRLMSSNKEIVSYATEYPTYGEISFPKLVTLDNDQMSLCYIFHMEDSKISIRNLYEDKNKRVHDRILSGIKHKALTESNHYITMSSTHSQESIIMFEVDIQDKKNHTFYLKHGNRIYEDRSWLRYDSTNAKPLLFSVKLPSQEILEKYNGQGLNYNQMVGLFLPYKDIVSLPGGLTQTPQPNIPPKTETKDPIDLPIPIPEEPKTDVKPEEQSTVDVPVIEPSPVEITPSNE